MPEKNRIKKAAALAALLVISAVSGCTSADSPSLPSAVTSGQSTTSQAVSSAEELPPETISGDIDPEETEVSSDLSDLTAETSAAAISETVDTAQIAETTGETESAVSSGQTAEPQPEVTQTTATTPATTAATTQTTAPPAPPVEVVIPDVRTVSSPKTDAVTADSGWIDLSNKSLGYISAAYTGSSKRAKLRIKCGDSTYDFDLKTDGTAQYFPLSCGSGSYSVILYEQLEGTKYARAAETEFTAAVADEVGIFLYPNDYVMFGKKSACVKKAAEVCAGKTDVIEKIAAVFEWVTKNITYDYDLAATVQSGYVPDPDTVLSRKKGICFDYASLVSAMLRSQDIPSRLVVGYASPDIYHAWNEVYTPETGWITPELLLASKGYNIVDATFYAGSSDKSAISAYISDGGNYSAIFYY
ncbi:MAG: transglutaminase family protein [Oscillospiraceae bacterium]